MKLRDLIIGEFTARRVVRSAFLVLGCVLAYVVYLSLSADRIIFVPPEPSYGKSPEIISIATPDGGSISALYLQGSEGSYTVLYSHGNAEDLGHVRPVLEEYQRRGFTVLGYDYRGYGTSGGLASEEHAYQDVEAAFSYLVRQRKTPPGRIIACGRSLGGAMAVYAAFRQPLAGLIVESGFLSAARVAFSVPVPLLDRFDSAKRMKRVTCPVLVMHGVHDDIIPLRHGQELYRLAPGPKLCLWVDAAGHNDLMATAGQAYWDRVDELVRVIRGRDTAP